ncbi:endonuclease domain-containing protein [Variovorax sp. H27-G14]|uniref:endonuclease domain-containing protein n=1 Tax=Variovorax sp. H27-G14 TaxID=3111914 RepID=UPI0038FC0301
MSDNLDTSGPLSRSRERVRVRARSLRETPTDAEALLWFHLRDRRLADHKFRRQRPIGLYFADFACIDAKLIVELDGGQHVDAAEYDENRTRFMQAQGYRVLRFWNHEVLTQTDAVRERILQALQEDSPHPNPLPQAGEGARQQATVPSDGRATQDTRNLTP